MEPITQGLLGAAVGQAGWRHSLGRSALLWGALVALLPDADVIFAGLHRGFGEFLYHRGTSHSLWFGFALGPLLGWCIYKVLATPGSAEHLHSQADIETPDVEED